LQFAQAQPAKTGSKQKKVEAVTDVWESMGMDQHLSERVVKMRKAT